VLTKPYKVGWSILKYNLGALLGKFKFWSNWAILSYFSRTY